MILRRHPSWKLEGNRWRFGSSWVKLKYFHHLINFNEQTFFEETLKSCFTRLGSRRQMAFGSDWQRGNLAGLISNAVFVFVLLYFHLCNTLGRKFSCPNLFCLVSTVSKSKICLNWVSGSTKGSRQK